MIGEDVWKKMLEHAALINYPTKDSFIRIRQPAVITLETAAVSFSFFLSLRQEDKEPK